MRGVLGLQSRAGGGDKDRLSSYPDTWRPCLCLKPKKLEGGEEERRRGGGAGGGEGGGAGREEGVQEREQKG